MFNCLIRVFNHFKCKPLEHKQVWDTSRDMEFAEWMYRHGIDVNRYCRYWHMYDGR